MMEETMIKLTKRDGDVFYLNEDMIEAIAENPDTVITLKNDNRYLVDESAAEIIDLIIEFKASILCRAKRCPGMDGLLLEEFDAAVSPTD